MGLFLPGVSVGNGLNDKKLDFSDPQGRKVLWILRKPYSNTVSIHFADGSSDVSPHRDAHAKLLKEGVKDPDKVLDFVWNFYEAKVVISDPKPKVQPPSNPLDRYPSDPRHR